MPCRNALLAACAALAAVAALLTAPGAGAACCYDRSFILGADPPVGHGVFRFPQGVTFSPGGQFVFVADQYSSVVQKFDRAGNWQMQVGWAASHAQLGRFGVIGGVATDLDGHLYVLDSENDRVQVFRSDNGDFLAAFGSHGSTVGRFFLGNNTGAGGLAVFQAASGDPPLVYVADQDNHRVQRFTLTQPARPGDTDPTHQRVLPTGTRDAANPNDVPSPSAADVVTWGHFADCSASGCSDPSFNAALNHPQGIAVSPNADGSGNHDVYVADDDNHRVVQYGPQGAFINQVGGFGAGDGQFAFPYDVGVDAPDNLYVADNNNHRVQRFDAATLAFQQSWGGFGPGPGQVEFPRALGALADDPAGGVIVTDTAGNRVESFSPDATLQASWGIAGRGPGYVSNPRGVTVDGAGNVYVADTFANRIEKLGPDGSFLGQWGHLNTASGFMGPGTGNGEFDSPGGVAFAGADGTVWVADTNNNRVQQLTPDGAWLATSGGPAPGAADGQFDHPRQIATDAVGDVFVADTDNNRIERRDPATGAWSAVPTAGETLHQPTGLAATPDGVLYIADTAANRVLRVAGGSAGAVAGPAGGLDRPAALALDGNRLYVADAGDGRVLRLDLDTGTWNTLGTEGPSLGAFVGPEGIAIRPGSGTLYVADTSNNRIQGFTVASPPPPSFTLTVTRAGAGAGTVASDPAGLDCGANCVAAYPSAAVVTLRAAPAVGSAFVGWTGTCSGADACVLRMDGNRSVGADFEPLPNLGPTAAPAARRPAPPAITGLRVSPRAFRAARSGSAIAAARRGATVRFRISAAAVVSFTIQRAATGRRVGTRCVAGRRSVPRARRCTRYAFLRGRSRRAARQGANRVRLTGRLSGRRLRPGRYRLVLAATTTAGARSRTHRAGFRVLP